MKRISIIVIALMTTLLIIGCAKNGEIKNPTPPENNNTGSNVTDGSAGGSIGDVTPSNDPMRDYFLPDGSKANYKGEGNEFAQLKVEVAQPYEHYFIVHENNGGAFIRRIYKIDTDKIEILEQKTVDAIPDFPSRDQLESMNPIGIYLQKPFSLGTVFDKWTIVETGVTVETPYKTFSDAFVIEEKGKDFVNRKYFVQGFGEVKRESIMKSANGEETIVTSTLESVTK